MRVLVIYTLHLHREIIMQHTVWQISNYNFQRKISDVAKDSAWGDQIDIKALSIILRREVYTYASVDPTDPMLRLSGPRVMSAFRDGGNEYRGAHLLYTPYPIVILPDKRPLLLQFTGNHYSAMLPVGQGFQRFVPREEIGNLQPGSGLSQDIRRVNLDDSD